MQELEKILEEIDTATDEYGMVDYINDEPVISKNQAKEIIRKHMNDGWIPVDERLPEEKRANYEVTFINECGEEEHGFARWYDEEFHVPAVVIAW